MPQVTSRAARSVVIVFLPPIRTLITVIEHGRKTACSLLPLNQRKKLCDCGSPWLPWAGNTNFHGASSPPPSRPKT